MKHVYHIEPIARRTAEVESLTSYLIRLAHVHCVSVAQLYDHVMSADTGADANPTRERTGRLAHLVRPTARNATFLGRLIHYTNATDLRGCTFLALQNAFDRSPVAFYADSVRWCPCCLDEDHRAGATPYLRLQWSLRGITRCPHHQVELIDRCPHCDAAQNSTGRRTPIHVCTRCKGALHGYPRALPDTDPRSREYIEDLIDLVTEIARNPSLSFRFDAARQLLHQIFDRVWRIEEERKFWEVLPRDDTYRACCGDKPLHIRFLRRVAYRLGISLPGLLAGEVQCWTRQLDPAWLTDLPVNLRRRKRRKPCNRKTVLRKLKAIEAESQPSKSLAQVARETGITTGGLEYVFPSICQRIKQRHAKWKRVEKAKRRERATACVLQYLSEHQGSKSRKDALRTIRSTTDLPKNLLREVIREAFDLHNPGGNHARS